jgi:hypothetical protein
MEIELNPQSVIDGIFEFLVALNFVTDERQILKLEEPRSKTKLDVWVKGNVLAYFPDLEQARNFINVRDVRE